MKEKLIGVYCILCLETNKRYIGSSIDIKRRFSSHKRELKQNKHKNVYLQNAYNKYGNGKFVYSILELCSKENLRSREQYYIDLFKAEFNLVKEVLEHNVIGKKIYMYDLSGKYIKSYNYIIDACKENNISQSTICRHLNGTYNRGGKFLWSLEYKDRLPPYIKTKRKLIKLQKRVKVVDTKTSFTMYFNSLKECAKYFGYFPSEISKGIKTGRLFKRKFLITSCPN